MLQLLLFLSLLHLATPWDLCGVIEYTHTYMHTQPHTLVKPKILVVPTHQGKSSMRYQGGLTLHLTTQGGQIVSSVKTQFTLYSIQDPRLQSLVTSCLMKFQIHKC